MTSVVEVMEEGAVEAAETASRVAGVEGTLLVLSRPRVRVAAGAATNPSTNKTPVQAASSLEEQEVVTRDNKEVIKKEDINRVVIKGNKEDINRVVTKGNKEDINRVVTKGNKEDINRVVTKDNKEDINRVVTKGNKEDINRVISKVVTKGNKMGTKDKVVTREGVGEGEVEVEVAVEGAEAADEEGRRMTIVNVDGRSILGSACYFMLVNY